MRNKGSAKGVEFSIQAMASILISVFIVTVIIVLYLKFAPEQTQGACEQRQIDEINDMVNDATSTAATTIRDFTVFGCTESVDFNEIICDPPESRRGGTDFVEQRCYTILFIGAGKTNCEEMGVKKNPGDDTFKETVKKACEELGIQGLVRAIHGSKNFVQIESEFDEYKFTPGTYSVQISPFNIKFLEKSN